MERYAFGIVQRSNDSRRTPHVIVYDKVKSGDKPYIRMDFEDLLENGYQIKHVLDSHHITDSHIILYISK